MEIDTICCKNCGADLFYDKQITDSKLSVCAYCGFIRTINGIRLGEH